MSSNPNLLDQHNQVALPQVWGYRLIVNIAILTIISFFCFAIIIIKENIVEQKLTSLSQHFYNTTLSLGFDVDDILIYGRNHTDIKEINNIINPKKGDNILYIDIHQLKQEIEQLSWVKSATIKRSYFPNIISIDIKEKDVLALWQNNNKFFPISENGSVIKSNFIPNKNILLIIGKQAPQNLNNLLSVIKQDAKIFERIKLANFISERRWNITLDDIETGTTIKLPEKNIENAWKKLIKLNKTQGILKRKLTIIDVRFDNKVLVTSQDSSIKANKN